VSAAPAPGPSTPADPRLELPLEQLVEIAAYADRQLSGGGRRSKG